MTEESIKLESREANVIDSLNQTIKEQRDKAISIDGEVKRISQLAMDLKNQMGTTVLEISAATKARDLFIDEIVKSAGQTGKYTYNEKDKTLCISQ